MSRLPPSILALTPGTLDDRAADGFPSRVSSALDGGLEGLLLREPLLSDRRFLELARELRGLLGAERWLGVHDRAHIALVATADAVHVGFRSMAVDELRAWCERAEHDLAIGLSTHAGDDPRGWADSDYVFHGPVRETAKAGRVAEPIGFEGLAAAVSSCDRPVWALGGLSPADVVQARECGVRGVAALSGILGRDDPGHAAREYLLAWEEAG